MGLIGLVGGRRRIGWIREGVRDLARKGWGWEGMDGWMNRWMVRWLADWVDRWMVQRTVGRITTLGRM